jgi:hypothetical protein
VRSLGSEAIEQINGSGVLGSYRLLPWQEYALTRALETRGGRLRWRTVIVTIGRQQGKSVLARSLCWWRLHQAERFGEPQLLLHTANKQDTAREVWRPAALHALKVYGKKASKFGRGTEEIDLGEDRGRWLVQAATDSTGVGYSLSMGLIDEAWNVARKIADESMRPAMSEREQPQLWLVSTAGDSSSDLLQAYRDLALQDTDGSGDILLLEWSAPPEAPYDDPATWRWASPNWSPRREEFLRSQMQAIPEGAFRTQYLNQWVKAVDAWMPPATWAAGARRVEVVGQPDVASVEVSSDGSRLAMVSAWALEDGQVFVRGQVTNSPSVLWGWVDQVRPRRLLLPPRLVVMSGGRRHEVVGVTELGRYLIGVGRAVAGGQVFHDPADHVLTDDIGRAVAVQSESGMHLSVRKSPGPTEAARAMVWAVGEVLKPAPARPRIRAAG